MKKFEHYNNTSNKLMNPISVSTEMSRLHTTAFSGDRVLRAKLHEASSHRFVSCRPAFCGGGMASVPGPRSFARVGLQF